MPLYHQYRPPPATATVAAMLAAISALDGCRGAGSVVPRDAGLGAIGWGTCSGSTFWAAMISAGSATSGRATSGVASRTRGASTCAGSATTSAGVTASGASVVECGEASSACTDSTVDGRVPHFLQNFAPSISSAPQPLQPAAATAGARALTGVPHVLQKRAPVGVPVPQFVQLVIPFPWLLVYRGAALLVSIKASPAQEEVALARARSIAKAGWEAGVAVIGCPTFPP